MVPVSARGLDLAPAMVSVPGWVWALVPALVWVPGWVSE
jgi:hypothetical protein